MQSACSWTERERYHQVASSKKRRSASQSSSQPTPPANAVRVHDPEFWRQDLLPVVVFLSTVGVFARLYHASFLFYDDSYSVYDNAHMNPLHPEYGFYWAHPYFGLYAPVSYSIWSLIAASTRLAHSASDPDRLPTIINSYAFHEAGVLFHAANAVLVYLILRKLIKSNLYLPAVLGAMLFAFHPFQVESVGWVTATNTVFCGFFSLISVYAYVNWAQQEIRRKADYRLYAVSFVAYLVALLAKPNAAALPLIVGALDYFLLRRSAAKAGMALLPWLVPAVAVSVATSVVQPFTDRADNVAFYQRPFLAGFAIAFYLYKLILPIRLSPDYGLTPAVVVRMTPWFYLAWIVPAALCVWAVRFREKLAVPVAGTAIFIAYLLPTAGLVQSAFQHISLVSDRYTYLALLGPALALAWAVDRSRSMLMGGLASLLVAACAVATVIQTGIWHDNGRLYRHALAINPNSPSSMANLGKEYLLDAATCPDTAHKNDMVRTAARLLTVACKLQPNERSNHVQMGLADHALGDDQGAIAECDRAIAIASLPDDYVTKGALLYMSGRYDEAEQTLNKSLEMDTSNPSAYEFLGLCLMHRSDVQGAADAFHKALDINPDFQAAHKDLRTLAGVTTNRGVALARLNQVEQAKQLFSMAIQVDPTYPNAYRDLGTACFVEHAYEDARTNFERTLQLNPQDTNAHLYLAQIDELNNDRAGAEDECRTILGYDPGNRAAAAMLSKLGG